MSDFITLTCPNCGGRLEITHDVDRFACAYCGAEHLVRRGGGIVTLAPVLAGLRDVQAGVNRAASELAIRRLETEIDRLSEQYRALAAQHAALAQRPSRRSWWTMGKRTAWYAIAAWIGTFAAGALLWGDRGAALGFGLAPVVAIFVIVGRLGRHWHVRQQESVRNAASRAQVESSLASLSAQIQDRQHQLSMHRQIVSG
ncbi:MAG TPA: hypothetical protein PKD09_15540 [Aggregatilinea sp.]|uniref:hypothetical protein n=1 Tax=Aggregatilinea sp. TaxID=2806333 RepID=UPI002C6A3884|nr:hypothetical protein [Aggregatilinea sp.]HML23066.1 hypothetical protein [Aggregatilinea sp.]